MTKNTLTPSDSRATATGSSAVTRIKSRISNATPSAIEKRVSAIHRQAELLQSFAAKSKRKLSLSKALEQASVLSGYKDYQTAKAAIEKEEANNLALAKFQGGLMEQDSGSSEGKKAQGKDQAAWISGEITPWEGDRGYKAGTFKIERRHNSLSVKLCRVDAPETTLEVILEMDADLPRVCIYTPETSDEVIFSTHSDEPGLVLQYMREDDQMYHKSTANEVGLEMMNRVAHATRGVWFIPVNSAADQG